MPPRTRKPPVVEEEMRAIAAAAGYVSPYPAPGAAPVPHVEADRCTGCGWTLFVSLRCAVYCINAKCAEYQRDLTEEVPASDSDSSDSGEG